MQGDGPNCRQWEVWRKVWDSSYVEKSSEQVPDLFHFPAGTTHTGMGRGRDHVFLLRCRSLNCVSVTAYIVSAPRSPWILNSGSDSFALLLIMQVANESIAVRGGLNHQRTFLTRRVCFSSSHGQLVTPPALEPGAAAGQGRNSQQCPRAPRPGFRFP